MNNHLYHSIVDAMKSYSVICFRYKGELRTAEPHLIGYDRNDHLSLSAWQLSGGSGAGFRHYHLTDMHEVAITDQTFSSVRNGYNPNDSNMSQVLERL